VRFDDLPQELVNTDIVLSSTASPHQIIAADDIALVMEQREGRPLLMIDIAVPRDVEPSVREIDGVIRQRRYRPVFLIDIAVPRDVDPRVENMDNVFLYDVDDLQQVAAQNIAARKREAEQAERLVDEEVAAFEQWQRSLGLTPTLVALRDRVRGVVHAELERTMPRLKSVSEAEKKSLAIMCDAIVNKLLHTPMTQLKKSREEPDGDQLVATVRKLFALDEEQVGREEQKALLSVGTPQLVASKGTPGDRS